MANITLSRLGLLEEPETRKPSKVRLAFLVLFSLLLILSAVFIGLYIKEKIAFDRSSSSKKTKHTEGPFEPTELSYSQTETIKPTEPSYSPTETIKPTELSYSPTETIKPTKRPSEKTKDTERPCQPSETNLSSDTCMSASCITSAAGMLCTFIDYVALQGENTRVEIARVKFRMLFSMIKHGYSDKNIN